MDHSRRPFSALALVPFSLISLLGHGCGDDGGTDGATDSDGAATSGGTGGATDTAGDAGSSSTGDGGGTGDGDGDSDSDGAGDPVIANVEIVEVPMPHPGGSACIEAACPEGKRLIHGGGQWDAEVRLSSSRPKDEVTYEMCGDAEMAGANWTVQAICAEVTTATMIATSSELVPFGAGPCVEVACPDGTVAVGGGAQWHEPGVGADEGSVTGSSVASPDYNAYSLCGWAASDSTWTVHAICVEDATADIQQSDAVHPGTGLDTIECISLACPEGQTLIGGGGLWTTVAVPVEHRMNAAGTEWTLCAASEVMEDWRVMAVCVNG